MHATNFRKKTFIVGIKDDILKCLNEVGVSVKKVILFGSRARGDYTKHSDYDFLIITEKRYTFKEKIEISGKIRKLFVRFHIPSDIIIKSDDEVEYLKDKIGSVIRLALKEGITI
ncbi:MAG: nucleotidyltransferase domain-containing protein [Candidatus Altiarchaeales archaeon HGW-Altiarchaeales-1]|nr:MAG: nucleotidyltransferase domain-containing protein [Candidatus Altiarchaeales archaeon HGW-Altiarchaeales-1]